MPASGKKSCLHGGLTRVELEKLPAVLEIGKDFYQVAVYGGIFAAVYTDQLPQDEIVESIEVPRYIPAPFVIEADKTFCDYVLGMPDFPVSIIHFVFFVKFPGILNVADCRIVTHNDQLERIGSFNCCPMIDVRCMIQHHLHSPEKGFGLFDNRLEKPASAKI